MEPIEYRTLRDLEDSFWWYRGLHRLVLDALRDLPPSAILDAGCGTGGLLSRISHRHHTIGLDFSPHALSLAKERGLPRLVRASVEEVPLREGQSYRIRPGTVHRMEAVTDVDILEASTPDLDDVVRLEDRYGRA